MEVIKLGTAKNNPTTVEEVDQIKLTKGKGIVGDRHFREQNDPRSELTLIESENIDDYNKKFNLKIPYLNFRRNIVTKGIKLNELIGKSLIIGEVEVQGKDLCRPCKHLQETLNRADIIKEFLRKGGLRCKIVKSGIVKTGDKIKII